MKESNFDNQNVFGKGEFNAAYAEYFTGNSYLNPLTNPEVKLFSQTSPSNPAVVTTGTLIARSREAVRYFCAWREAAGTWNTESPR